LAMQRGCTNTIRTIVRRAAADTDALMISSKL